MAGLNPGQDLALIELWASWIEGRRASDYKRFPVIVFGSLVFFDGFADVAQRSVSSRQHVVCTNICDRRQKKSRVIDPSTA